MLGDNVLDRDEVQLMVIPGIDFKDLSSTCNITDSLLFHSCLLLLMESKFVPICLNVSAVASGEGSSHSQRIFNFSAMVYVFILVVPSFLLLLLFVEVDAVVFALAVPSFLLLPFFVEVDAVLSSPFFGHIL